LANIRRRARDSDVIFVATRLVPEKARSSRLTPFALAPIRGRHKSSASLPIVSGK
jgi:hypothetical protein